MTLHLSHTNPQGLVSFRPTKVAQLTLIVFYSLVLVVTPYLNPLPRPMTVVLLWSWWIAGVAVQSFKRRQLRWTHRTCTEVMKTARF